MATTKIWPIHAGSSISVVIDYVENEEKTTLINYRLETKQEREYSKDEYDSMTDVMEYAMNDYKTDEKRFVSGVNVSVQNAREDMMTTKKYYRKEDKIILWHGYQSFVPGEVTPEEAHKIGIELAQSLWSDYEVIVSTHIDKAHIHNHFVINSVSFKHGKKLDGNWFDMKRESDRLCQLYGKSIIENPEYKGKHYAQYMAEKEGHHTWQTIFKEEIDEIIKQSHSLGGFFRELEGRGWTYKVGKYLTLKPPGRPRGTKIDRHFGPEYSVEGIEKRIAENVFNRSVMPAVSQVKMFKCVNKVTKPKQSIKGYQALYYYYCYKLGVLPKRRITSKQTNYLLREELRNIDKISKETRFLGQNNISTEGDLLLKKQELKSTMSGLLKKRQILNNNIKSATEENKALLRKEIDKINCKIKTCRQELFYCKDIEERSGILHEKANLEKQKNFLRNKNEREV